MNEKLQLSLPTCRYELYRSAEVTHAYRGTSISAVTVIEPHGDSICVSSLDVYCNGQYVDYRHYLGDDAYEQFFERYVHHFWGEPLTDEWWTTFWLVIDVFIGKPGIPVVMEAA